jgi:hypothetical protein
MAEKKSWDGNFYAAFGIILGISKSFSKKQAKTLYLFFSL